MNNSHWIIFFVRRHSLPQPFKDDFVFYAAIEVFFDIVSICVGIFGIYVFYKVKYFNFNLAAIWINAFLIALLFIMSRFILVPFEFGYLKETDVGNAVIVHVSTLRFLLWIALYHFEILIVLERIAALYFVATYEKVPRRYISAAIITSNYAISATLSYLVVHRIVHGFYYLAFVLIAGNISYFAFLYLNRAEKRLQTGLLEQYRGYSVSYRWQLQRNIAAADDLSILMIVTNITVSIILPCIFVPAFILENDDSKKDIFELAKLLLQLMLSPAFAIVYVIFILVVSKHREWLFGKKRITDAAKYQPNSQNLSVDAHIARLQDTWNAKLDRRTSRN